MDITPIYELRTRLRAVAIAGTGLLSEDFRLKRAAEALQPLEAASPVFAKIGALTRSLFSAESPEREGILLDAITLTDALLCTQGEVAVPEEMQELPIHSRGSAVSNAPYSDVKAILDALTNSGGGRYSYLTEMHSTSPGLFEDYRVKPAMVQALGASYAELADDVEKWLMETDDAIVPLLQKGFDPKGKKEMVRRVRVIEALAGADANDFYLEQLPDAEKEVRQALIYALRHSPSNGELLLSLVKTEKGNAKKMAYCALSCQESSGAQDCIVRLMEKNPEDGLAALSVSNAVWAEELLQKKIFELADKLEDRAKGSKKPLPENAEGIAEDAALLNRCLEALQGKDPRVICGCVKRAAALADNKALTIDVKLGDRLQDYVAARPDEALFSLAEEMYDASRKTSAGGEYFAAALLAKVLGSEDCSEWLAAELAQKKNASLWEQVSAVLNTLHWSGERKKWVIQRWRYSPALDNRTVYLCELKQEVRGDFLKILMDSRRMNVVLGNCIPGGDTEYEQMVMDYFYRQALEGNGIFYCISQLRMHNYPKCEGIAVQYVKSKNPISMWELKSFLNGLPGSSEARRAEGREVLKLVSKGLFSKSRITNLNMEELEALVEAL